MKIAFLGLGKMGLAITRHLAEAGHEITVWNRTRSHAEPLAKVGAKIADSAASAVSGADVVFTMVFDDAALEDVLFAGGVLQAIAKGATHVSMSTISVALSERLTAAHEQAGVVFLAAPVFGRPEVAEAGKLYTVVAGEANAIAKVRPLLETFSRAVAVVGARPAMAHALKLGGNFLITAMIASLSESLVYAESLGIEPEVFFETANAALFRSPFYEAYGKIMLHPPEKAGGTIALGEKDLRLFREAAVAAHARTPLADVFETFLKRAIDAGMQDADWAAGYYQLTRDVTLASR